MTRGRESQASGSYRLQARRRCTKGLRELICSGLIPEEVAEGRLVLRLVLRRSAARGGVDHGVAALTVVDGHTPFISS